MCTYIYKCCVYFDFRLSGLSPFMGETDIETMANVTIAKYDFDDEVFNEISENAKDFIQKLLLKDKEYVDHFIFIIYYYKHILCKHDHLSGVQYFSRIHFIL